jgi:hypothetical protein
VITSVSVKAGDQIKVSIAQVSAGSWQITLTDVTASKSFSTTQNYGGPLTSAEWIEEAPTVNGSVAKLANYGQTTFDPETANGHGPQLTTAQGGYMVQNGVQSSTPSTPDSEGDGFACAYGSNSPSPPAS